MKDNETKARFVELRAQWLPLKRIADEIGVSKTTLVNWEHDFMEQIDGRWSLRHCTTNTSSRCVRKSSSLATFYSRIQGERETRDMSTDPTEKLFAMYAHFYREAQRALPELTFRTDEGIETAKTFRLSKERLSAESRDLLL